MASRILRPASALAPESQETLRAFGQTGLPTRAHRIMLSVCLRRTPQRQAGWKLGGGPVIAHDSDKVEKRRKVPNKLELPSPEFSSKDIPPRTLWEGVFQRHAPGDLTIADLERTAQVYCTIALRNISTWKGTLERGRHRNSHHAPLPVF